MDTPLFTSLRLQNFRSYDDFAVELAPAVNIVVGPNASGKTNLLESLLILCGFASYRAAYGDIIANNKDWARVDGNTAEGARVIKLNKHDGFIERTYEINGKIKKRLSFNDKLPVVLFEPEHMRLLTGQPQLRRDFLDEILTITRPDFGSNNQKYRRVLAQRNHLLKSDKKLINSQIFAWNVRLSELAGKIVSARVGLIKKLNNEISKTYSEIAGAKTAVQLNYDSSLPSETYETALLKKLENSLEIDAQKGFTTYGPHREDVKTYVNKRPAEIVASRGETRTLVIALKLLSLQLIENARSKKPLVLLDDVFSELDGARRHTLTQRLEGYQAIITTTDADIIGKNLTSHADIIALM
jgi:DNA replication and repair protein RecF